MIWLVIISLLTTLFCVGRIVGYKRQINHICRQIAFHRQHESNIMITNNIYSKEAKQLVELLNKWIIHERKLTESYNQKEEQIKETISGLSHDIRTPLTSLDGYCQLLATTDDPDQSQRYLAIMSDRIESLKNLIEELFQYAKLQIQSPELVLENIDLNQVIFDTVFSFFDDFSQNDIKPNLELKDYPVFIMGDESSLKRVVQNIVKNTLEHGFQDFTVKLAEAGDLIHLQFSNTAHNLDQINIDQVFERFYKGDSARQKSSTGLGLAIAKQLIERMNGSMSAEINGNVFTLSIYLHRN